MKIHLEPLMESPSWENAFDLQKKALADFHERAGRVLVGSIPLRPMDPEQLKLERNLFSTFFLAVIGNLGIDSALIPFYATSVHCLRTLVTGCDNILDDEYKEVIPFKMGDGGKAMKSVFMVMAAQGILSDLAMEAQQQGLISNEKAMNLIPSAIRVLAASGMEEHEEESASEEEYPTPELMLENYLYRKTGKLFESPVNLLVEMGEIDRADSADTISMLSDFGIACQLLDEIRDFPEDLASGSYNMVSALMYHRNSLMTRERMASYALAGASSDRAAGKAHGRARRDCFDLSVKYFLRVKKQLPEIIPDLKLKHLSLMTRYIKKFILKDDHIEGELL